VYQVRTINYIKEKSAVQRAGQALGIPASEIIATSKGTESVEDMPDGEWKELAMKFRGHIISYGCHASALLVAPEDVNNWTAVEKQKDNMVVCHDFHQLEEQGLLKLDILGLETLDIIENTKHRAGVKLDLSSISTNDKATADMLKKVNTLGCFQIETKPMSRIIREINVNSVEDLVATVALCRPGPLDSGMVDHFLARRKGTEKVEYDHPLLEPILKDTEGIILYQEQIMQIAQKLCGYTLGQADNLRRIIGRKKTEEMGPVIDDMISKGINNGISKEAMKKITDDIVTFARYGFNRGHSAAYGMTSWVTAWLKAHYPCEFMASVIDANCKDKDNLSGYILEAMRMGIKILPPKVSCKNCYSDYDEDGPYIILGLNCIKGFGNMELPENSPTDFIEFMKSFPSINKKAIEGMIKAGVFEGNRDEMIQYVSWFKNKRKSKGEFKYSPTNYDEIKEQTNVIGIALADIFKGYDKSLVNYSSIFIVQTLEIKHTKTKKGKPMCFVKARDERELLNFVMFNKKQNDLDVNKVYLLKTRGDIIMDFMEAKTA
jgi:DNA polymerase-3 subunit alpha